VFRYYPFVPRNHLPEGAELLQVTNDPWDAAAAVAGDSLLSDARLALEAFIDAIPTVTSRPAPAALTIERKLPSTPNNPLTALEAFAALSELRPQDAILVNETASNFADLIQFWPIQKADTYDTFASGGLGWGLPASVGVALAEKKTGTGRPVVAVIGDGAFQYSIQQGRGFAVQNRIYASSNNAKWLGTLVDDAFSRSADHRDEA
jgi:benzoylformate decarboxylase